MSLLYSQPPKPVWAEFPDELWVMVLSGLVDHETCYDDDFQDNGWLPSAVTPETYTNNLLPEEGLGTAVFAGNRKLAELALEWYFKSNAFSFRVGYENLGSAHTNPGKFLLPVPKFSSEIRSLIINTEHCYPGTNLEELLGLEHSAWRGLIKAKRPLDLALMKTNHRLVSPPCDEDTQWAASFPKVRNLAIYLDFCEQPQCPIWRSYDFPPGGITGFIKILNETEAVIQAQNVKVVVVNALSAPNVRILEEHLTQMFTKKSS